MKDNWNGTCTCGHLHSEHGPSGSINYTAGRCGVKGCNCLHFLHARAPLQNTPSLPKQDGEKDEWEAVPGTDGEWGPLYVKKGSREPDRPVEDTPQEKKRPHGEITDVVGWIPVEQAFRIADWIDKEIEFQLSTANATIETLKEELSTIKHQYEKEPLAFLLSNALRLLSMEQMISLADSLYERTPSGSGICAELAKYKDQSPKY